MPVAVLAMVPQARFGGWEWLALALVTPVVFWSGLGFHRAAFASARHGGATMDTLISIGTLAAWTWSTVVLVGGLAEDTYFEVAGAIATLILLGRWLEARAKRRSGAAIRALAELGAKEARLLRDGVETLVPVEELRAGDRFVVLPGDRVATDGVVESGGSALDVSLLTGEPVPVEVVAGDEVAGGTVNTYGRLVVRATRVGSETALAQIARLVEQAQTGKAQVQRLADRVSAIFVPVVLVVAVATLAGWLVAGAGAPDAFTRAVAVLIIACPCALGLATPTALMVGTGRGAQLGILIKGPEILERTHRIGTIVLDKTGTVTEGRMELVDVVPLNGATRGEALRLAGAVEAASEHPVARAVAAAARAELGELPPVDEFRALPGSGAVGVVEGRRIEIARGVVSWDGAERARLVVSDTVKPTSAAAIAELRQPGSDAGAAHRRRAGDGGGRRGRGRDRARARRGAPGREGRRDPPAPGGRRGRGDGRRRRQRRARPRAGRPRTRARHRHRGRDRGLRPDARLRRPARRRRRDPARTAHALDDQGEPLLGVRLQRRRDPARRRRAAEPDRGRGRDGVLEPLRRHEQPAPAPLLERPRERSRMSEQTHEHTHPGYHGSKDALIKRLHRIEGQVRGIEAMVADDRYCIDVLTQIGAVSTALESVAFKILDEHVRHCVAGALASGDEEAAAEKSRELLEAVHRFTKTR